jgi:hypothetical protein
MLLIVLADAKKVMMAEATTLTITVMATSIPNTTLYTGEAGA